MSTSDSDSEMSFEEIRKRCEEEANRKLDEQDRKRREYWEKAMAELDKEIEEDSQKSEKEIEERHKFLEVLPPRNDMYRKVENELRRIGTHEQNRMAEVQGETRAPNAQVQDEDKISELIGYAWGGTSDEHHLLRGIWAGFIVEWVGKKTFYICPERIHQVAHTSVKQDVTSYLIKYRYELVKKDIRGTDMETTLLQNGVRAGGWHEYSTNVIIIK